MEKKEVAFHYIYRMEGHETLGGIDPSFYWTLPGWKEEYVNSRTGVPELPRPDIEQLITVIGTAILSSSVVATAITAWLQSRRRKITISVDGTSKKVEYEGPNIKKDLQSIEAAIDKLVEESNTRQIQIIAQYLPDDV